MPFTKAEAGRRLNVATASINYLIEKGRLLEATDGITEASLFHEVAQRYEWFSNALAVIATGGSNACACGCGEKREAGKIYISGHDQRLEGVLKMIIATGNRLDQDAARKLAVARNLLHLLDENEHAEDNTAANATVEINDLSFKRSFFSELQSKLSTSDIQSVILKALERLKDEGDVIQLFSSYDLAAEGSTSIFSFNGVRSFKAAKSLLGKYMADEIEAKTGIRPTRIFRTKKQTLTF